MGHQKKCVLKRIRKGAYECANFLVLHTSWIDEKWDGPQETFRSWRVYTAGSFIEKRVLLDSFASLRAAYDYVQRQMDATA